MESVKYIFFIWKKCFWKSPVHLCLIYFICVHLFLLRAQDLYTTDDNILLLNSTNFNSHFYGKENVFALEFYNSWCGACKRFKKFWKGFANDIKGWKKVVQIAAINCVTEENSDICADFNISGYPRLKYFWINTKTNDLGTDMKHHNNVTLLRQDLLKFIDDNMRLGTPNFWPDLKPTTATALKDLWRNVPASKSVLPLVIEESNSFMGREIILDLSSYNSTIIRILNNNTKLMEEIKGKAKFDSSPALLLFKRNGTVTKPSTSPSNSRETIRAVIEEEVLESSPSIFQTTTPRPLPENDGDEGKNITIVETSVHMTDLENTIRYALRMEIGRKLGNQTQYDVLKKFLNLLNKFFPGRIPVKNYINYLYSKVAKNNIKSLDRIQYINLLRSIQTKTKNLPPIREWKECKGSTPLFRGYPRGLWTLFHTLSVQAYNKNKNPKDPFKMLKSILIPIKDYVLHFFSCAECVNNFRHESANMLQEFKYVNDTVLWLWKTHNSVNKRLSGDETDDPKHPKMQYPPVEICSKCHVLGSTRKEPLWNEGSVLKFLRNHYKRFKYER